MASLLGHSRQQKNNNTRCVLVHKCRWNTWAAHPARPRAQITHTAACLSQVWGEQQKEGRSTMSGEGETSAGQCAVRGMQDDVKDVKTAGGASIQNTEHNSPRSPSGGTCSGVPARPQPPGHAVFSCQNIGGPKVPRQGKSGQTIRAGTGGGECAESAEEGEWIGATRARSTKRSPDG